MASQTGFLLPPIICFLSFLLPGVECDTCEGHMKPLVKIKESLASNCLISEEDQLSLNTSLVHWPECITEIDIVGGAEHTTKTYSWNSFGSSSEYSDTCDSEDVAVTVTDEAGVEFPIKFKMDPLGCFDQENEMTFLTTERQDKIKIPLGFWKDSTGLFMGARYSKCVTDIQIQGLPSQWNWKDENKKLKNRHFTVAEVWIDPCKNITLELLYIFKLGSAMKTLYIPSTLSEEECRGPSIAMIVGIVLGLVVGVISVILIIFIIIRKRKKADPSIEMS